MTPSGTAQPAFILFTDLPKAGPYLEAIAARGLRALVVTGPPQWPLEHVAVSYVGKPGHPFEAVEELTFLPAKDTADILTKVISWAEEYQIRGVFASSETFVEPAGQAADLLGLPGVGLRAARVCRNKHLQRLYLGEWSPVSLLSTSPREVILAALADRFPLISKPLDLYCSIGVRVLRDSETLESHLDNLTAASPVLLEECVSGREFSVETIVTGGQPVFSSVTQKLTNEDVGNFFVEMGHTQPACNLTEEEAESLKEAQASVLARLDFGTGMAHGEYRILPDGRVVLMEIAARPPGDGILHLYQLATGASIEAAVIDAALGVAVHYPKPSRWARQIYFDHTPGKLDGICAGDLDGTEPLWVVDHGLWPGAEPTDPDAPAGLRQLLVLKERGTELGSLVDSFGRAATALFDAPTPDALERFDAVLRETVSVTVA